MQHIDLTKPLDVRYQYPQEGKLDMNSSLGREALDQVAASCGLERRSPGDPPHHTHR